MPYEYKVYHEHRLIHERGVGTVTDDDFLRSFAEPPTDPDIDLSYDVVSDYRHCDSEITIDGIRRAADLYALHYADLPLGKWAVISPDERGRLRAHFFACFADNPNIRCFREIREALTWLDLPDILIE